MPAFKVVELEDRHLPAAAALVGARYRKLQARVPTVPSQYADPRTLMPLLSNLVAQAPGVAALLDGELVGFLVARKVPTLWGRRSAFSPEWAHAIDPRHGGRRIYEELYAAIAPRWVANGCLVHAISLLAAEEDIREAWHWLGFGMAVVDAVRGLDQAPEPAALGHLTIRRAGVSDLATVIAWSDALDRHLAAAPTFLAHVDRDDPAELERWLADPANALWLAEAGNETLAGLQIGPASDNACTVIRDAKTASIVGAFTAVPVRGQGVATALLNQAMRWARETGYVRCAVDFEAMNTVAARFWLRHFHPVCYSLARHLDERITWAHERRPAADFW